jgi:hypothetical protein
MNAHASTREPSVWADLASVALPIMLFAISVFIGLKLGLIAPLSKASVAVLATAMLSIGLTNMFGFYAEKRAELHRIGFQLCGLNLGTCLSLLAIQLLSSNDVLPGLAGSKLANLFDFLPSVVAQRAGMISLLGFISILTLGMTARIVRAIDHESPKWPAALKLFSYAIGFTMIFANVLLIMGNQ